jgi:hypothetical protein
MANLTFRVREHTRTIKGATGYADHPDYWVYVSDEFHDYYEALKYAIAYEKSGRHKCWVELIGDEW